MNNTPRVSVLMPVRNGGRWLLAAVHSVLCQTLSDWSLVIVDDHSTDGALASLPLDARVQIVPNAGRGVVDALNTGLAHCTAPYVARLDADDLMHPERLHKQLSAFEAHPECTVVASRVRAFSDDGVVPQGMRRYLAWQNRLTVHRDIVNNAFVEAPVSHPSVMMRTAALRALGGYRDTSWAEDFDLWLRGRAAGWQFLKLRQPLTDWRDHATRLTRTDVRCARDSYIAARAHHLAQTVLQGRSVAICGGGKHAIGLCRMLRSEGAEVSHFYDVAPRRVGGLRQGSPVLPLDSRLKADADTLVLGCVARPQARHALRRDLQRAGLVESEHFLMVV